MKPGNYTVRIRDDESFEKALRQFRKLFTTTRVWDDIKKHRYYTKPSEKRNWINNRKKRLKKRNKKK